MDTEPVRPVSIVRQQTDRIHDAADKIELASTEILGANDWRIALGFIDGASLRLYNLRQQYLKVARERAKEMTIE